MKKKDLYYLGSLALFLAVIGIVFVVNYASNSAFTRVDLTRSHRFTLSPSTVDALAKLPDVITIKAVYSSNIPTMYAEYINEVKDMLREYQLHGKGKVRLEIVDPTNNEELQTQLGKMGIQPALLPISGADQATTLKVWASIYLEYLDKNQIVPNVVSIDTLEYDLTSTVRRLTAPETIVGLYNIDEGRKIDEEFGALKKTLEKEFKVEEVSTSNGKPIEDAIKVLLVLNPMRPTDRDLFEIDQFIMRGGQVIFLIDGVQILLQPGQYRVMMPLYAMPMNEQIDTIGKLVSSYGVKRNFDLVQEPREFQPYPIVSPELPVTRDYPLFPIIDFTKNQSEPVHPITSGLQYLIFTWNSSLEVEPKLPDGVTAVKLIVTTPQAYTQAGSNNQMMVDPMKDPMPPLPIPGMGPGERTLAAILSGKFKSNFAGKPAPGVEAGETGEAPPAAEPANRKDESVNTNILVIGGSKFISDQSPVLNAQNLGFILTAVEWMSGGQSFSDIRNRKADARPMPTPNTWAKILAMLVAPLTAPLAVIIFGVARFAVREQRKKRFLESVKP
jgi:gliding-associated putative ABC transporter substrate-binding component GldG